MGDPKKIRKKYETPGHPWEKTRIDEEKALKREYGFGNKKELWKMASILKNFKDQVKNLIATHGKQADVLRGQLRQRIESLGLLQPGADLDEVLGLSLNAVLDRRLQTVVYKKGLARSVKQARQFIVHRHIKVNDNIITSPSYLVSVSEESMIEFSARSAMHNTDHPERYVEAAVAGPDAVSPIKKKKQSDKEDKKDKKEHKKEEKKEPAEKVEPKKEEAVVEPETEAKQDNTPESKDNQEKKEAGDKQE